MRQPTAGPGISGPPAGSRRGQAGVVGFEVLPFLVLVFVVGTLVFVQAWAALDAKIAVTAGAREATRAFTEHRGASTSSAVAAATEAGRFAVGGYRLEGTTTVAPVGTPDLRRCVRASFEVSHSVPELALPTRRWLPIVVYARSTEVVDPFRHDLPGNAPCAS